MSYQKLYAVPKESFDAFVKHKAGNLGNVKTLKVNQLNFNKANQIDPKHYGPNGFIPNKKSKRTVASNQGIAQVNVNDTPVEDNNNNSSLSHVEDNNNNNSPLDEHENNSTSRNQDDLPSINTPADRNMTSIDNNTSLQNDARQLSHVVNRIAQTNEDQRADFFLNNRSDDSFLSNSNGNLHQSNASDQISSEVQIPRFGVETGAVPKNTNNINFVENTQYPSINAQSSPSIRQVEETNVSSYQKTPYLTIPQNLNNISPINKRYVYNSPSPNKLSPGPSDIQLPSLNNTNNSNSNETENLINYASTPLPPPILSATSLHVPKRFVYNNSPSPKKGSPGPLNVSIPENRSQNNTFHDNSSIRKRIINSSLRRDNDLLRKVLMNSTKMKPYSFNKSITAMSEKLDEVSKSLVGNDKINTINPLQQSSNLDEVRRNLKPVNSPLPPLPRIDSNMNISELRNNLKSVPPPPKKTPKDKSPELNSILRTRLKHVSPKKKPLMKHQVNFIKRNIAKVKASKNPSHANKGPVILSQGRTR